MKNDLKEHLPEGASILRLVLRLAALVVGMTVLFYLLPLEDGRWWIDAVIGLLAIGAVVPLTYRRVQSMKTAENPALMALEALMMVVILLVYGFSALYLTLNRNGTQFEGMHTRVDAVYFTVTTLSTVGFGDIHATGQSARLAVTAQILIDFTVLALSVRVLVAATRKHLKPGQSY